MVSFNWSWADYEREKRKEERKAAKAERPAATETVVPAPARPVPAIVPLGERIPIHDAPSAMEASAERWRAASPIPLTPAPIPESQRALVLCRCGGGGGKRVGFVPSWFGDKCIEGDCPLRGIAHRKVRA